MARQSDRELGEEIFDRLRQMSKDSFHKALEAELSLHEESQLSTRLPGGLKAFEELALFIERGSIRTGELRKMKKFRFQLLHRWLVEHFQPCRAADIGGGKGMLTYLLRQDGWDSVVIDPVDQSLLTKYKDISTGKRVRISPEESVPRIDREFEPAMGTHFDLLVGMHAHGANAKIIDSATSFGCGFILFPCCVIDEPFYPRLGVSWLESLADYAIENGHVIYPFRLNFKGQNIGLCSIGRCRIITREPQSAGLASLGTDV